MYNETITKDELSELPLRQFEGDIILVETPQEYSRSVEYLTQQKMLGFDTETKPAFKKGVTNEVALLQLSTNHKAFLFRLNKIGFPDRLKSILADPGVYKIGVAIHDDIKGLQKLNHFDPDGFVELQDMVKKFGIQNFSLKKLVGIVLGFRISKAQRITNWEANELSEAQQLYAATDAWAPLEVYQSLSNGAS